MKPEAPSEYRGDFRPIKTNVPVSKSANTCPSWPSWRTSSRSSARSAMTARACQQHTYISDRIPRRAERDAAVSPQSSECLVSHHSHVRRTSSRFTVHVANHVRYDGSAYLGNGFEPFLIKGDPNHPISRFPDWPSNRLPPIAFKVAWISWLIWIECVASWTPVAR